MNDHNQNSGGSPSRKPEPPAQRYKQKALGGQFVTTNVMRQVLMSYESKRITAISTTAVSLMAGIGLVV